MLVRIHLIAEILEHLATHVDHPNFMQLASAPAATDQGVVDLR